MYGPSSSAMVALSINDKLIPPGLDPFLRAPSAISLAAANMDGLHASLSLFVGIDAEPVLATDGGFPMDSSASPALDSAFCTPELLLEVRFRPSPRALVSPTAASTARSSRNRIRTPCLTKYCSYQHREQDQR